MNYSLLIFLKRTILLFGFLFIQLPVSSQLVQENESDQKEENQEQAEPDYPKDPFGRNTPRGTVRGFISAVASLDYNLASQYLNLDTTMVNGEERAEVLQRLLDQGYLAPFTVLQDDIAGVTDDGLPEGIDKVGSAKIDGNTIDIYVERIDDPEGGPIWLFSAETMESIEEISLEESSFIDSVLPQFLKDNLWGGVPVGQWIAVFLLMVMAYLIAWAITVVIRFLIRKFWKGSSVDPAAGVIKALALPIGLYISVWLFVVLSQQAGLSIILRQRFSGLTIIVGVVALLILLWRLTHFLGNFSKKRMSVHGNASGVSIVQFLQRAAKVAIIIIGGIIILNVFGVDVTAGLAALGIGGIALALGAQKTVENFVGSVTLITDQPVRVGDFIKVGEFVGTVENIGMRSTRIRTLNRTIITIPNGIFSSESIENFAHRDRFWFHPLLELRYETTPDQIRYLLVAVREVLYAHPMVSPDPARIRFVELGKFSLNMEIFAYVNAPNFDVFLEVQEDLLLRIMDVVEESGSGFAIPAQTVYIAQHGEIPEEKVQSARERVKQWRENNELQIPNFDPQRIKNIKNTIPYPPEGSVMRKKK